MPETPQQIYKDVVVFVNDTASLSLSRPWSNPHAFRPIFWLAALMRHLSTLGMIPALGMWFPTVVKQPPFGQLLAGTSCEFLWQPAGGCIGHGPMPPKHGETLGRLVSEWHELGSRSLSAHTWGRRPRCLHACMRMCAEGWVKMGLWHPCLSSMGIDQRNQHRMLHSFQQTFHD